MTYPNNQKEKTRHNQNPGKNQDRRFYQDQYEKKPQDLPDVEKRINLDRYDYI